MKNLNTFIPAYTINLNLAINHKNIIRINHVNETAWFNEVVFECKLPHEFIVIVGDILVEVLFSVDSENYNWKEILFLSCGIESFIKYMPVRIFKDLKENDTLKMGHFIFKMSQSKFYYHNFETAIEKIL